MFLTHAIQGQIDDHFTGGSRLQDAFDASGDDFILNAVGGNIDDARTTVSISRFNHLGQIFAQRGFATAKGEPVGVPTNRREGLVVLFKSEVIIGTLPNITGFTTRVTAITYANREVQWKSKGFA